jgi:hypothetical protein
LSVSPDEEVVLTDPLSEAMLVWWASGAATAASDAVGRAEQPAASKATTMRVSFLVTSMCASGKIRAEKVSGPPRMPLFFAGGNTCTAENVGLYGREK